jgi:hypothetical protein
MRQRAFLADGDYSFGTALPFLVNTPLCVAQAIMTRLRLATGEWFLDVTDGTDYQGQILGFNTQASRDLAIRTRILNTPGVKEISNYISLINKSRQMSVIATVNTQFGSVDISTTVQG